MWGDSEVRWKKKSLRFLTGEDSSQFEIEPNTHPLCSARFTQRAIQLEPSDALATILFQVTGPAHIPWQDPRWQELLHGYNVWVHVELKDASGCLEQACKSLVSHASRTSNLAALSMHVTRMLRELLPPGAHASQDAVAVFSDRIAMVGKARATAGALNLLRILIHAVTTESTRRRDPSQYLEEIFLYQSRDSVHVQDTGHDLLDCLLHFVASDPPLSSTIPELYDTTVLSLQLILVLFSSQLYQPMISSFQRQQLKNASPDFFWDKLMQQARNKASSQSWKPLSLISVLLEWHMGRPVAPKRSIAHHNAELAQSVVRAKGEKLGLDGMYESHLVVNACAPHKGSLDTTEVELPHATDAPRRTASKTSNMFIDATKGVLVLSSSIILLPFRLMSLALGLWGHKEKGYDTAHRKQLQSSLQHSSRTKDVLWLTESPVADLSCCLLLLLTNNERAGKNHFRKELKNLADNRWESDGNRLPDLPDPNAPSDQLDVSFSQTEEAAPLMSVSTSTTIVSRPLKNDGLTVNFEALFESFGLTAHTEPGALLLYTLLQASPSFADAIAVRSDLDTLVLPLLRTLYFASSLRHYAAQDYVSRAQRRPSNDSNVTTTALSIRNCPFRSQSQLYVIIILLLLFSQDSSFGADAFRRVMVPGLVWYKERNLKDISLGSILLLLLLRSLSFNLNRLQDAFLLSNCCAVLMNLSPSIVDLHEYAAMRLASVTISSMKRYTKLREENPNEDEDDMSSPTAMHGEVSRTLVRVIKHCLSAKNIEHNLHLVYALVYHQTDFKRAVAMKGKFESLQLGDSDYQRADSRMESENFCV